MPKANAEGNTRLEMREAGKNHYVVNFLSGAPGLLSHRWFWLIFSPVIINAIKAVKNDLHSDRTSATSFLANAMRLLLACAASALHHALRTHTLQHTALAQAQPSTVILTLFKIATQIKQYKDRILLHLPSSCPVKALLQRVTPCYAPFLSLSATRRKPQDAPCRTQRLTGPTAPRCHASVAAARGKSWWSPCS